MTAPAQHVLSVMVVALNEERHLPGLKAAVDKLHLPQGWTIETILVDGGSRDGTVAAAREAGFDECLVRPGASIPVCRNHALRAARGTALAFLDGDCLPDKDWLEHAAPWLLKPTPVLLGYPVQPPETGNWIHRSWHAHWRHKHSATQTGGPVATAEAFRLITTRNMLFNRALLDVVPAFDETLTTGEDTDFAFRAAQAGCEVVALPTLRVAHLGEPSTLREYFRQQLWHANRKAYATILKSSRGKSGANAIFFSVLFLLCLLLAVAGLALAAALLHPWFLLLLAPLALVTTLPAVLIADRARSPVLFLRLTILYFLYGLARSLDLVGLSPRKKSWKS